MKTTNPEDRSSIVALNIVNVKTNVLLSKHIPIIYDWNGEGTILDNLTKDKSFIEYLKSIGAFSIEHYSQSILAVTYYGRIYDDESKDDYKDIRFNLQVLFHLDVLEKNDIVDLSKQYLFDIYKDLYINAIGNDILPQKIYESIYKNLNNVSNDNIIELHNEIKNKYGENFITMTEINYVRSQLLKKYELYDVTIKYIIEKLTNLLEHE